MRFLYFLLFSLPAIFFCQTRQLKEIEITGKKQTTEYPMTNSDFQILEGKKAEVIHLQNTLGNKATNSARQIMAKIPGLNIWEHDGSGIQINVSTRGLSPNRSWEFNTRQNGYDMSADVFGYPEAYYNPPLEAVSKIEFIRGASALQYGPQFGGLLNYTLKREKSDIPIRFEGQVTGGSYGLFSLYTALGGNTKKWNYYTYNQLRKGDGWRQNSQYTSRNTHAFLQYKINSSSTVSAEYTNSDYKLQQAGGLTDLQFKQNSMQSFRSRNWFSTPWQIAQIKYEYKNDSHFNSQLFFTGLWGERSSIGYLASANKRDTINPATRDYTNRQLDRDFYRNFGMEWRNMLTYQFHGLNHQLAFGVRAYTAHTDRNQRGKGTTDSEYNTQEISGSFPTSLDFTTKNISFFAENTFHVGERLSLSPGLRYEWISSEMTGRLGTNSNQEIPAPNTSVSRSVILGGLSVQYRINPEHQIYSSATQAFRPILFGDLVPVSTLDVVDPNLKDANGWNFDLGARGNFFEFLKYDFSLFYLIYNNRIGTVRQFINNDPTKSTYLYRTNLGQSINKGIELMVNLDFSSWLKLDKGFGHLEAFTSLSYIDAEYQDFSVYSVSGTTPNLVISEKNLKGNKVEYVPTWIISSGIQYRYKKLHLQAQTRFTTDVYTDALNTEVANPEATVGKLEGYTLIDLSGEYTISNQYSIGLGVNNLVNKNYATRRSGGYPGPGLVPGEGRTWFVSFGIKL